ncbi:hypothetical protein [Haloprofundus halobius]|uniref:hypothetical protein n=1 Tax=Haloprofundus halobius TaxID=2876194 RepID=UPI001CCC62A1|nr:hypothetical protein [Haloprofundus halobius]
MSQSEHQPSIGDGSSPPSEQSVADAASDAQPSVSIQCPSCDERVSATLALSDGDTVNATVNGDTETEDSAGGPVATDGGSTAEGGRRDAVDSTLEGELCGKPVRCSACDDEFELLFYH